MSLWSGRKIHTKIWDELPIDKEAIEQVHKLAQEQNQPIMRDGYPVFEWRPGVDVDNPEEDDDNPDELDEIDETDLQAQVQQNQYEDALDQDIEEVEFVEEVQEAMEQPETPIMQLEEPTAAPEPGPIPDAEPTEPIIVKDVNDEEDNDSAEAGNDENNAAEAEELFPEADENSRYTFRTNRGAGFERLSPRKQGKSHDTVLKQQYTMSNPSIVRKVSRKRQFGQMRKREQLLSKGLMHRAMHVLLTQMHASRGIKLFGERAVAALIKEFKQLVDGAMEGKPVVAPIEPCDITPEMKRKALRAVNLIKEKRTLELKGRCCADGSKQKQYLAADESISSPTLLLEGLLTSLMIDVAEGRQIAISDIAGAFLHPEMKCKDGIALMKLEGQFVDIMCEVNPEFRSTVIYENGKKVLYMELKRSIYGCIEAAMLWYQMYTEVLEGMGFEINPYDMCVANKIINGSQCTICFYVDDNKISHVDVNIIKDVISELEKHFGPMTTTLGDEFNFIGMNICVNRELKTFSIEMKDMIKKAIDSFGEELDTDAASPATKHLLNVKVSDEKLNERMAETYHSVTAQLLYIMKRARPDIDTAVAFLCTRVKAPVMDDWKKLKRVLTYLQMTLDDV